jgi:hypothetical protein
MVLLAVMLSATLECELAPWLADQAGAIRDSAHLVVEGTIVGLRLLPPGSGREVEVTISVARTWRESVSDSLIAHVVDYECGPELYFLGSYVLGLWREEKTPIVLAAVERWEAVDLVADLGGPLPLIGEAPKSIRWYVLPFAVFVVLLLLSVFLLTARRRASSR